jgi:hypothetical protein
MANWVLSTKKQVKERYLSVSRIEFGSLPKNTVFNGRTHCFFRLTTQKNVCYLRLYTTEDQGHSFEIISPDLSEMIQNYRRNGGPITKDQTGAEVYYDIHPQNHR